VIGTLYII
jgi:hypothetical protein